MNKKTASIIGIIIGIIIVIIGFSVRNTSSYAIGDSIAFGADFYTEMYAVTKDVGRAINYAINDLIRAVGWLIVAVGLIDIAYFTVKAASCGDDAAEGGNNINKANAQVKDKDHVYTSISVDKGSVTEAKYLKCSNCGKKITHYPCEHCGRTIEEKEAPYWCGKCGYLGPFADKCPQCGSGIKIFNTKN